MKTPLIALVSLLFFGLSVGHSLATDYDGQTITGNYQETNFTGSTFVGSTLIGELSGFQDCNFSGDNMQGVQLLAPGTSSWQQADFFKADLQFAVIDASGLSSWQGAEFNDANLEGVHFENLGATAFETASFSGALLDSSTIFWDGKNYQTTSFDWKSAGLVVVPEPSCVVLFLAGVGLILFCLSRRSRAIPNI